jgi:transposase
LKNTVKDFTVVADAAMISESNVQQLLENNINCIAGARLGNLSGRLLKEINETVPASCRYNTDAAFRL